ncbi:penicillin acylase family protein [Maribellus maritimus]|uniref:penicillin acylase family protein n=1 Tax=Maribellus maritimus TaxID=2870838 RepID=UPI001EEBE6ED|nr:penicillin acylase family protein [Maribellus maritimus]MCG6188204.1 penicillin acylase family protein [Maribellus maritimus]
MRTLKRILLGLLILIVIVVAAGYILLKSMQNDALPDYNRDLTFSRLTDSVSVFRDENGIPHIFAQNEKDLYRAVGFVMAQDRLWQMDLLRRVTQGRLSEIMGKDQINTDLLMRSLRIQEKSEQILQTSSPEIVAALEAFSEGFNYFIERNPLPPEFRVLGYHPEYWEPVHSINLIGYMAWDLSSGWGSEIFLHNIKKEINPEQLAELIPDMKNQPTEVFPDFTLPEEKIAETLLSASENLEKMGIEIFHGSNNWAISGKKSKTGKPILANDMHLGLFAPGIWYQIHQSVPGKLNVTGLAIPGQPFIIAGHNDSIAWGMTNVMVDDLDFYAEKLNEDSTKYLFDGEWKDLIIQEEIIKTKEGDEIHETLKFTHRGPLVNRFKHEKETPLSVRWLGNEMSNEIRTVFLLNRANNWSDFRDAVKTFISVSQNIVYADVEGNIGLQCSAGIPVREGNGIQIYPGDSSKYDWKGIVPFEELPYELNPGRGYVSSANNKTVPDDYPYYVSHWFAVPNRINRIREMLQEKEKLGIEDFKKMHADYKSKKAEKFTPVFLEALAAAPDLNETEKEAQKKLATWNFVLTRESQATSVFEILYRKVCENLVKDELSEESFKAIKSQRSMLENLMLSILSGKKSDWIDDKNTTETETFNDIIVRSFKETVADLTAQLGNNVEDWNWSKIHTFTMSHPLGVVNALDKAFKLNRGPYGVPGSFHTVSPFSYSYNNLYTVNHGASHRHIFDAGNWDASKTIIPTGTSGIPSSDFYLDQLERYLNNEYHADPFSKTEVKKAATYKMSLKPE